MRTHTFHEGILPADTSLAYPTAIFNSYEYRALHGSGLHASFYLIDERQRTAVAGVHFHLQDHTAWSPFRAPFGSFEADETINPKLLYEFIRDVQVALKRRGVREVYVKNPPRVYHSSLFSLIETFLLNHHFVASEAEVSCVLPVGIQPFGTLIRHSEQLRRRQGEAAGLRFQVCRPEDLEEVYRLISAWHVRKKYRISISAEDFKKTISVFPDRYLCFCIRRDEYIVAAAIAIRVTDKVLYNFMMSHSPDLNHLSPPVLLIEGMYAYCVKHSIPMIDLGTSAIHGEPNFNLLDFKMHLGAIPSAKFAFHKRLE